MVEGEVLEAAQARLTELLATVMDPEIPVLSVVDLGILRRASVRDRIVRITPTYTGCPASETIARSIRRALDEAGFADIELEVSLSPAWSTDMISEAGRGKLLAYGIAPPETAGRGRPAAGCACPRCGSLRTQEISRFGSTPCKALWRCLDCREPFDRFKCH